MKYADMMELRAARERIRELEAACAAKDAEIRTLRNTSAGLLEVVEAAEKAHTAITSLMAESHGVTGLHLNGDDAPWDSLCEGGYFEDWLIDVDRLGQALAALGGGDG